MPKKSKNNGKVDVSNTQPLPVAVPAGSNGDGHARVQSVRPVKARVGLGYVLEPTAGNGSNGHERPHGNGHANGYARRLDTDTLADAPGGNGHASGRTGQLRDTDLLSLRLRLKTGEWAVSTGRRRTKRALPYFLMRQRNTRTRAAVGHTRKQAAARKFGRGRSPVLGFIAAFLAFTLLAGSVLGVAVGGGIAGAAYYVSKLPPIDPESLSAAITEHGYVEQTSKIYDRNEVLLSDFVDEDTGLRHEVKLDEVSPYVISATLAAEDASFWTNLGVDPVGIARAVRINLSGEGRSGGSTITQQLVRQILMSREERREQTFQRKVKEAVLAVQMTREYSKQEIFEMYLNQNYYGHRAYGIGGAALTYFGKPAKELNLAEAALIAGLTQSPTEYDPFVNPEQAKGRQAIVLDLMVKQGMVTREEADAAKAQDITLGLRPYEAPLRAPHFVHYVKGYLEKAYGPDQDIGELGLEIYTTLDLGVQGAAEQVARDRIDELRRQKATNASIVIMKPGTGEILAMLGSVDYNNEEIDGQVNVAIRERQPGSSFKPITYATAFKNGWSPGTVLMDALTEFPNPGQKPYVPKNYDGRDHGWVTVRESLGNSYNIPAVKALQYAGVQDTIDTAHDMGIKGLNRGTGWYGLSLTLGGGEVTLLDMTTAYSTFANEGVAVDANPIRKIVDAQGRIIYCHDAFKVQPEGECVDTRVRASVEGNQALDPRHVYMITSILSDNRARSAAFGPNSPLRLSFPAAAKTGTTDDNRDSWTLGYTPQLAVGVWVGNSNNDEMLKVTGAIGAAVIWHNMVETFYKTPEFVALVRDPDGKLPRDFAQPDGLIKKWACSAKGDVQDFFLRESPPKGCTTYKDKNKQLRSVPQNQQDQQRPAATPQPQPKPTPLPGIWPPIEP